MAKALRVKANVSAKPVAMLQLAPGLEPQPVTGQPLGAIQPSYALGWTPTGQAVVQVWSNLPQEIQQHLFEAAVLSQGESTRQQLAVFLHEKHLRTTDALKARAMPEPDSKGG